MAAITKTPNLIVDQKALYLHLNPKENKPVEVSSGVCKIDYKPRTTYNKIIAFSDSALGPFRGGQLGERVFKLLNLISPNESFKNIATMFNKGWTVTIFPRLLGASKDAVEAIKSTSKPASDREAVVRKYVRIVHDVADAGASWGYAVSMILGCFKKLGSASLGVLKAADTVTFVGDITDLTMQAQDLSKARTLASRARQLNADQEVQGAIGDSLRYYLLKTLKAVCSVAGFVLGTTMAITGCGTLLGFAIAGASISLGATCLAVGAGLHEEGMKYDRIKFFDEKHVQVLTPTAA